MEVAMYISPDTHQEKSYQRPPVIVQGVTNNTQAVLNLSRWMRAVCYAQEHAPDYRVQLCGETRFLRHTGAASGEESLPEAFRGILQVLDQIGR